MEQQYKSDVYKSREGRHLLHNLYRKHLQAIHVPVRERMIETYLGDTHVSLYGNPSGKPVLTFYGGYAINPLAVRPFTEHLPLDKIQLIVPDPPGQVGFSSERKLSFPKHEYGEWASQVMDGLELQTTAVLGYSFGGSIALQLCLWSVLRVECLLLVLPSGIADASPHRIAKLVKPSTLKNENQITDEVVKKALTKIVPFQHDELIEAARTLFAHAQFEKIKRWNVKKNEIRKLNVPVYLIAEKSDYLFPGKAVRKQARRIIPRLEGQRLLTLGSHCGLYKNEPDEELNEAYAAMSEFLLRQKD
ncbi:MAG: alpha/beta hydrolase [Tannerella sp.]|nr:alpha/beta hydrolase [Tannerella sp.]